MRKNGKKWENIRMKIETKMVKNGEIQEWKLS